MGRNKAATTHEEHTHPQQGTIQSGGTAIQGLESIPRGDVDGPQSFVHLPPNMGQVINPADRVIPEDEMPPPPQKFMLMRKGTIVENGLRVDLPEGKIIDTANYDIAALRKRGFKLQPITDDDDLS